MGQDARDARDKSKLEKKLDTVTVSFLEKRKRYLKEHPFRAFIYSSMGALFLYIFSDAESVINYSKTKVQNIFDNNYEYVILEPFDYKSIKNLPVQFGSEPFLQYESIIRSLFPFESTAFDFQSTLNPGVNLSCENTKLRPESTRPTLDFQSLIDSNKKVFTLTFQIRDPFTQEVIVDIVSNKVRITKALITPVVLKENSLEILDKHGFLALKLWIDESSVVQIRGYYAGVECVKFMIRDGNKDVTYKDPDFRAKCIEYNEDLKQSLITPEPKPEPYVDPHNM